MRKRNRLLLITLALFLSASLASVAGATDRQARRYFRRAARGQTVPSHVRVMGHEPHSKTANVYMRHKRGAHSVYGYQRRGGLGLRHIFTMFSSRKGNTRWWWHNKNANKR